MALKAQIDHGILEGPGSEEISRLMAEIDTLNMEVKTLTQQLLQAY